MLGTELSGTIVGGTVTVSSGGAANAITVDSGTLSVLLSGTASGTTVSGLGAYEFVSSGGMVSGTTVTASAEDEIFAGGAAANTTINNGGTEEIFISGIAGSTTISSGGKQIVDSGGTASDTHILSGGVLEVVSGGVIAGSPLFLGSGGYLQTDDGTHHTLLGGVAVSGFVQGDTIDLAGIPFSGGTVDLLAGNELQIIANGGTYDLQFDASQDFTGNFFHLANDGLSWSGTAVTENTTPCYCRGTLILTEQGDVPVEQLRIGQCILTRSGEAKPIKWIGHRAYAGRFLAGNPNVLPIRIAAGALSTGIPARDLWVSPEHALLIDDLLVPARLLLNGATIMQPSDVDVVEYFHIELEEHDIIFAEATPAETFIDCDSRGMFHNADEFAALFPNDARPRWRFCASRLEAASGELLAIRARLAGRAGLSEAGGPPDDLQGHIDRCDRIRVEGWAFDPMQPQQRIRLAVYCDNELVGHVVADRYRTDLADVGYLGDGRCSFSFAVPVLPDPLSSLLIELRRAMDGAPLPGSPVILAAVPHFDGECRQTLDRLLSDIAQGAQQPSELDSVIEYLVKRADTLLGERARLDGGSRGAVTDLHDRWSGLLADRVTEPTAPSLRPQALFIDEVYPSVGESGGANAALDHMCSLLRLGFDVYFAAANDPYDLRGRTEALSALGIKTLRSPWYGSIEEILRRHAGRIDLVYLHRASIAAAYARLVRQYCPRAQLLYSVADLHHLRLARQSSVEDRPELVRQAARVGHDELIGAQLADIVITHSAVEANLLRARLPNRTVAVVPWSVPQYPATAWSDLRSDVLFIGGFGHEPNLDAVYWLAEDIVPLLQQLNPAICIRVIGSGMPASMRRLARPGLELVGPVDDVGAALARARLTVAPLRYGAGLKSKVVESLAAGAPCVGTRIAYEGIETTGLAGAIVDTPVEFARAVARLYCDQAAHALLANAGQQHSLAVYSPEHIDALMRTLTAPVLSRWAEAGHLNVGSG